MLLYKAWQMQVRSAANSLRHLPASRLAARLALLLLALYAGHGLYSLLLPGPVPQLGHTAVVRDSAGSLHYYNSLTEPFIFIGSSPRQPCPPDNQTSFMIYQCFIE